MKTNLGIVAVLAAFGVATPALFACTATSTVDLARLTRDRDDYRAARDVATEFIDKENATKSADAEKFVKDTLTLDAATGTLLASAGVARGFGGINMAYKATTVDGFRALLDRESDSSHGYTSSLNPVGPGVGENRMATVREHVRQHVYEWDVFVKTGREMFEGMATTAAEASKYEKGGEWYSATYRGQQEGATAQPIPSSVEGPAPAPKPVASSPAEAPSPAPAKRPYYFRIVRPATGTQAPAAPAPSNVEGPVPAPAPVEVVNHAG